VDDYLLYFLTAFLPSQLPVNPDVSIGAGEPLLNSSQNRDVLLPKCFTINILGESKAFEAVK
jgi:hypothetical protein